MDVPTYQELLAEQYEDNAKNLLVFQKQYENADDEEGDVDYNEEQDYTRYQLEEPDKFNQFLGNRNTAEYIAAANAYEDKTKGSVRYDKDVRTHIVDIDTRFRAFGNGQIPLKMSVSNTVIGSSIIAPTSNVSNFVFGLPRLLKNIITMKITSISFPNMFWTYQSSRDNISFNIYSKTDLNPSTKLLPTNATMSVTITEGNYSTVSDFMTELNAQLAKVPNESGTTGYFKARYIDRTGKISIYREDGERDFGLDFSPPNTPELLNIGLGYYMGYQNFFYGTAPASDQNIVNIPLTKYYYNPASPSSFYYEAMAESFPSELLGESYVYLSINELDIVQHQSFKQSFLPVFCKILLPEATKGKRITDINLLNVVQREINFLQPINIQKLLITIYDRYGNIVDMQSTNFSFTLKFEEVLNPGMYEKLREL